MVSELSEQVFLAKALRLRGVCFAAVPNGGKRTRREARALVASGVERGVPDLLVFDPPPARPGCVGTALELKRASGGVVSDDQRRWLAQLEERGWAVLVAYGAADAVERLRALGYPL